MAQRPASPVRQIHARVAKHGQRRGVIIVLPTVQFGEIDELRRDFSHTRLVA
jgi:hypothetical protein